MSHGRDADPRAGRRRRKGTPGPSRWEDSLVTVVLLAYLGYAMVVLREQGLPFATIIGGLLGGYLARNHLKRRGDDDDEGPPAGGGKG